MSRKSSQLVNPIIANIMTMPIKYLLFIVFILLEIYVYAKYETLWDRLRVWVAHRLRVQIVVVVAGDDEQIACLKREGCTLHADAAQPLGWQLVSQAQALKARAGESGYVEKSNKDETFRYHIARVNDEDDGIHEEPMLTNEDLVLGIRPEFLSITGGGNVECEIYGAMPTGMESTVKVRIGEYLLTGVVFGSTLFTIGSKHLLDITGSSVMLFDRSSGRRITSGTLKLL